MSDCSYTAFSAPQPIRGQINWANGHRPTPLSYARFVNGEERIAESAEIDGVVYAPVRECEFSTTANNSPKCSNCGWQADTYDCDWLDGGAYEYDGRFCKHCGARVRGGGDDR